MRGAPEIAGTFGSAWEIKKAAGDGGPPDWGGCIAAYQVNRPGAHAFWSWWLIGLVHLRPIAGVRPAFKQYPDAEYELHFFALDPDAPMPDPDEQTQLPGSRKYAHLTPADLVYQFHGINDEQAKHLIEMVVKGITLGGLSPDSDFRSFWKQTLTDTIQHIALGGRPKEIA